MHCPNNNIQSRVFVSSELLIFEGWVGCVTTLTQSCQHCLTSRLWMDLCQCQYLPVLLLLGDKRLVTFETFFRVRRRNDLSQTSHGHHSSIRINRNLEMSQIVPTLLQYCSQNICVEILSSILCCHRSVKCCPSSSWFHSALS